MDGSVRDALQMNGWMGRAMPRREDNRLLRGQGLFVDDLQVKGCLFLDVLRSPYPAGQITTLEISEAVAMAEPRYSPARDNASSNWVASAVE